MKNNIHPQYNSKAQITCANCSKVFTVGTTKDDLKVEICSACHPFFTGKKVLIDTEGRVDKFRKLAEGATGRKKKDRRKKTLEQRVNEDIAIQLQKDKEKEEAAKAAKEAKKAKPEPVVEETPVEEPVVEEATTEEAPETEEQES